MGEVRQVFVSSENRDLAIYPYGNSYTLHLTQPIKDIHKVELIYASVPNVLYNLTNGSNVITVSGGAILSGVVNFSLTPGFYNASTLATELTQTINITSGVSVQYIQPIGKFLFVNPSTSSPFSITINSLELATMMGITPNIAINSNIPVTPSTPDMPLYADHVRYVNKNWLISNVIANLAPNEGIFLDIHELRTMFNEDALAITGNTYTGQNVSRTFGLIPMDVVAGGVKHFKKSTDYDFCVDYVNPIRTLDRLTVEWVDRRGKKVSFNGLEDNSFMLRFHTLRKNL
jgi:hypothetical protein